MDKYYMRLQPKIENLPHVHRLTIPLAKINRLPHPVSNVIYVKKHSLINVLSRAVPHLIASDNAGINFYVI